MGITTLSTVLPPPIPSPLPKTIFIDSPCWIVEALTSPSLSSLHHSPVLHLFFTRTVALLKLDHEPVFVFDSPDISPNPKFHQHQAIVKSLVQELGCAYHRSSSNSESLCSLLHLQTPSSSVITNDTDAFAYGCSSVFKNVTCSTILSRSSLLQPSPPNWSRSSVIAFAYLVGSDLCPGVKGVGSINATTFIEACSNLKIDPFEILDAMHEGRTLPTSSAPIPKIFVSLSQKLTSSKSNLPSSTLKSYTSPPHSTSSSVSCSLKIPVIARTLCYGFSKEISEPKIVTILIELQAIQVIKNLKVNHLVTLNRIVDVKGSKKYVLEWVGIYKNVKIYVNVSSSKLEVEKIFPKRVEEFERRINRMKMNVETVEGRRALFGLKDNKRKRKEGGRKFDVYRMKEKPRRERGGGEDGDKDRSYMMNGGKMHRLFSPGKVVEKYHMTRSPGFIIGEAGDKGRCGNDEDDEDDEDDVARAPFAFF
ncbi:hypothetical protein TrST_g810 [Triparma strigata]|uniref:XPG-I domain-containing protein n=1 Tax=Triparma strigata TaxID=1606541 RepID=A0A9W7BED8_9STRA|nr:hypothetical protein TrST_g810 [Triparma strigata]